MVVYVAGGLGEAVLSAVAGERNIIVKKLAVPNVPRSGPPKVLLEMFGISAKNIIAAVKEIIQKWTTWQIFYIHKHIPLTKNWCIIKDASFLSFSINSILLMIALFIRQVVSGISKGWNCCSSCFIGFLKLTNDLVNLLPYFIFF